MKSQKWILGYPKVLCQVLKPAPGRREHYVRPVGELFAMKVEGVGWMFGRVITNDLARDELVTGVPPPWARVSGQHIVYIYNWVQADLRTIPALQSSRLIYAVEGLNATPWRDGYVKRVKDPCHGVCERIPHVFYVLNVYTNRPDLDFYFCDERGSRIVAKKFQSFLGVGGTTTLDEILQDYAKAYKKNKGRVRNRVWWPPLPANEPEDD